MMSVSENEKLYFAVILEKCLRLQRIFEHTRLEPNYNENDWFAILSDVKNAQGNLDNMLSFLSTMMAKKYLAHRFNVENFDAAAKPQGAPGLDIDIQTIEGKRIVCEIKNTIPYQKNFGAAQRSAINKDLAKLRASDADFKLMMVTNDEAFGYLCSNQYSDAASGVEIINLKNSNRYFHLEKC